MFKDESPYDMHSKPRYVHTGSSKARSYGSVTLSQPAYRSESVGTSACHNDPYYHRRGSVAKYDRSSVAGVKVYRRKKNDSLRKKGVFVPWAPYRGFQPKTLSYEKESWGSGMGGVHRPANGVAYKKGRVMSQLKKAHLSKQKRNARKELDKIPQLNPLSSMIMAYI